MQNKTYVITAMIDGWEFALARDIPEEEVEGELRVQHRWLYVACEEHKHGH